MGEVLHYRIASKSNKKGMIFLKTSSAEALPSDILFVHRKS